MLRSCERQILIPLQGFLRRLRLRTPFFGLFDRSVWVFLA